MLKMDQKYKMIKLFNQGYSRRAIARELNCSRELANKTIKRYLQENEELESCTDEATRQKTIENIVNVPSYDASNRTKRKLTNEIQNQIKSYLDENEFKTSNGMKKQRLKKIDIHELFVEKGFDISYSTVSRYINEVLDNNKIKEAHIKQVYEYGQICEYDFGEVVLYLDSIKTKCHMAVMTLAKSNISFVKVYKDSKMLSFLDSQVEFFNYLKAVPKIMVYDNMRNVVKRFISRNERELTEDLMKLSLYYNFDVKLTNPYSPNEKGHVEHSVEVVRRKVFGKRYRFKDLDEANKYLLNELNKRINTDELLKEVDAMNSLKPRYDVARVLDNKVDKYSFIQIEKNKYSVPDYLVGTTVTSKIYINHIDIYANNQHVCTHKKIDGEGNYEIDISHYLNTLHKKPGALKNSLAMKQVRPHLLTIYTKYFNKNEREFIDLLKLTQHFSVDSVLEVVDQLESSPLLKDNINLKTIELSLNNKEITNEKTRFSTHVITEEDINTINKNQISKISALHGII